MKKLLFAISVAIVALASCQKFADEGVVNFEKADVPTVTLTVTGDQSVSFTVTPGTNTGYYAYALLSGEVDPKTVDAATLLAGKVAGSVDKDVNWGVRWVVATELPVTIVAPICHVA